MKHLFTLALTALLSISLTACAQQSPKSSLEHMKQKKTLVAFFSRADENYGVGNVEKGNTQVVAEMIAEALGADTFHIQTATPYARDYDTCIAQAKREKESDARPAIVGDAAVEDYDVIFIGYPNWWGEPPMALYTFIERHKWEGKIIVPFITHEGSGFGGTDRRVAKACKGATALKGFATTGHEAQLSQPSTRKAVGQWLSSLSL